MAEPGFKPWAAGWEPRMIPLCYASSWPRKLVYYFSGTTNFESEVKLLSQEVLQLKQTSHRIEQDLAGAKNDVGIVQESLAQVQASAEAIAERVDRFANTMRQLERQATTLIAVSH